MIRVLRHYWCKARFPVCFSYSFYSIYSIYNHSKFSYFSPHSLIFLFKMYYYPIFFVYLWPNRWNITTLTIIRTKNYQKKNNTYNLN